MVMQQYISESEYQVPILVVDDVRDNLDLMEALLVGEGFQEVVLVESGEEALQVLKERSDIGLVLLDLMMPGMSGYEVCSYITNNPSTRDVPVIAVTGGGYVQNEALEKSFMSGALDYISKPVNEVELFARSKVAIQLYQERRMRKESALQVEENEERFRTIFQDAPVGIAHLDAQQCFMACNNSFQALVEYGSDELIGESVQFLADVIEPVFQAEGGDKEINPFDLLLDGTLTTVEASLKRKNGSSVWVNLYWGVVEVPSSELVSKSYILIAENITEKKLAADKMREMAYYDSLTSLPNRVLFSKELDRAVSHARAMNLQFSVLFLDLDYFKTINDSLGHDVGDEVLKSIAKNIQSCIRDSDVFARLAGDEFALLLPKVRSPEDACVVAQKILNKMQSPLEVNGHELYAGVSIGVSFYPLDGEDTHSLLKSADTAMYRAKELGRQNYQLFNPSMDKTVERRLDLEQELRRGIKEEQFVLHYQPQVNIQSGKVTGLEALVRWQHPDRGLLSPIEFLGLAEDTGLILPLGDLVLRKCIQQAKQWLDQGMDSDILVSANLSLRQFQQHDLVKRIASYIEEFNLPPKNFAVEVTESINSLGKDVVIQSLNDFRAMGIHTHIDDFGMGFSSLNHLRRFALDGLKVDRSFVQDAVTNPADAAILKTIIELGKSLSLVVIAEGVETEGQRQMVADFGCDAIQGYFYSKPLMVNEVMPKVIAGF